MIDRELLEQTMRSFMYRHPVGGSSMKHKVALIAIVAAILAVSSATTLLPAKNVSGDTVFPKVVIGYVYDLSMNKVDGASVSVSMIDLVGSETQTRTETTVGGGFYSVSFDPGKWDIGYTIRIDASKGAMSGSNETICDGEGSQYLNVTLETVIPEFSSYVPVICGTLAIAVMASVSSRRRRAQE